MRVLVACPSCRRQYDASDLPTGRRFACSCGAQVEVPAVRTTDAAVVRCSSCGSTRQAGEGACRWCGSEFTLEERDLNTICPGCATRIGDRARHCHACGLAVDPQPIGAGDPLHPCPACASGPPLRSRSVSKDLVVLECERCGGVWIAPGPLRDLVLRVAAGRAQAAALLGPLAGPRTLPREAREPTGPLYRPCVVCRERMNRTRFAGDTPIVVDYCRRHGVWFDEEELATALAAVGEGRANPHPPAEVVPGDGDRARALNRPAAPYPPRPPWIPDPRSKPYGGVFGDWDGGALGVSSGIDVLGAILRFFR